MSGIGGLLGFEESVTPFARPTLLRPPPFSRCPPPAERAKLPGAFREAVEETAFVPARWEGCRLESKGGGPPRPTSRVMLDRAVRGTEATRTFRG